MRSFPVGSGFDGVAYDGLLHCEAEGCCEGEGEWSDLLHPGGSPKWVNSWFGDSDDTIVNLCVVGHGVAIATLRSRSPVTWH